METGKGRLLGIDTVRYAAFVAVVLIHTVGSDSVNEYGVNAGAVLGQMSRFAVPFFFIASGYFLAQREQKAVIALINVMKRIVPVFLFWLLFYVSITDGGIARLLNVRFLLSCLVSGGPGYHLWFLPSLSLSAAMLILLRGRGWFTIFSIAIIFYVTGLTLGSYKEILQIGFDFPFNTRNGPFHGFLFILVGYWIAKAKPVYPVWAAVSLCVLGMLLHLSEAFFLDFAHFRPFAANDFLLGTVPFGIGTFLLSLKLPSDIPAIRKLSDLGTYSLGLYGIHLLFVLAIHDRNAGLPRSLADTLVILLMSTLSCMLLVRVKVLRRLLR
ncbi:acyltransferase [Skermanella stibiiresistens]|uniref:acyltransferase n=1 Tax=Skermanella stibiiresistens TaxID=913326 RepID=UPI0018DD1D85|nr:acyltransferase family protein [Skermanella stibiiresistens]